MDFYKVRQSYDILPFSWRKYTFSSIKEKIPNFATNSFDKNIASHQSLTHTAVFFFPKHEISPGIVQPSFNPFTVHWPLMGALTGEGHWEVVPVFAMLADTCIVRLGLEQVYYCEH